MVTDDLLLLAAYGPATAYLQFSCRFHAPHQGPLATGAWKPGPPKAHKENLLE